MKKADGCFYCDRDAEFQAVLYEICDLRAAKVFLCRDQTLPGRCTIMFKEHYDEIYEIPKAERDEFMDDVCALSQTIKELFDADKINYAIYGDNVTHVHYTLCPKFKGKLGWGGPFVMFPDLKDKITLTETEYQERMLLIKQSVQAKRRP